MFETLCFLGAVVTISAPPPAHNGNSFFQDISTQFTPRQGLPSNDVRKVEIEDGYLWAFCSTGLVHRSLNAPDTARWEPAAKRGPKSSPMPLPMLATRDIEPTFSLKDSQGRTIVGARVKSSGFSDGERGTAVSYLYKLFRLDGNALTSIGESKDVRALLASHEFTCGASDKAGHLWIGTPRGIAVTDGNGWFHMITGKEGLPVEDVRCIAVAPNGDVWAGADEGACRLRDGRWSYFCGKRWMPGNQVRSITVALNGDAWLATDGGVARIESRSTTFAEKAKHYEEVTAARHNRNGFVTICRFKDPEDLNSWEIEASDNDGIWSGLYCAAECFRYASTKEPEARELARKSMRAIMDLERLTGISGFPARCVVKKDEKRVFLSTGEWHDSTVDPNYRWKGDTSSDELDGHYFVYSIYYDLVADEKEKEEIRALVRRITDHLLKNGYRLIDMDGKPTRWAVYGPQDLNDNPEWEEQRCLNSLSMLKYLKVAHHITADGKYQKAYEELVLKHHYLLNAINQKQVPPAEINHSDDQLAFMSYYPILLYERDAEYRRLLLLSLERSWQIERPERNPFFDFVYGAVTGKPCDAEESVSTLQEWPSDLRHWNVKNSYRSDITISPLSTANRLEGTRVLPAGERRAMQWSDNPYVLDGGDNGRREYDGAAWLLAYWLGRYHNLIPN